MKKRFWQQILTTLFLVVFFTQSVFAVCWESEENYFSGLEAYPAKSSPHVFAYFFGDFCWNWRLSELKPEEPEEAGPPRIEISLVVNGQEKRWHEWYLQSRCPEMTFISALWDELLNPGFNRIIFIGYRIPAGGPGSRIYPDCQDRGTVLFYHELDVFVPREP